MQRGILAQFESVNEQGGVFGRRLQLSSMNDAYDPRIKEANAAQVRAAAPTAERVRLVRGSLLHAALLAQEGSLQHPLPGIGTMPFLEENRSGLDGVDLHLRR